MTKLFASFLVGLILLAARAFASSYHFADTLVSYPLDRQYSACNVHVRLLEDHGGGASFQNSFGPFKTEGDKRLYALVSGEYNQYTLIGAGEKSSARYGQLYFRVGKNSPTSQRVVLGLVDEKKQFGPRVLLDANGLLLYDKATGSGQRPYATNRFEDITINYDLQSKTYELWLGTEKLADGLPFSGDGTAFGTPSSMAAGAAYWAKDGAAPCLDQWYWKISEDDVPFASCGKRLSEDTPTTPNPYTVNLADFAKGDGSDETAAIQKAFDTLVREQAGLKHREKKGVLHIPAPVKFYGISKTINVYEKWNVLIEAETPITPASPFEYFKWLGSDGGAMFAFNYCGGLRIENLSMSGNGKRVTGILLGDDNAPNGFFKHSSFNHLSIMDVGTGITLGGSSDSQDIAHNSFRDVFINGFSEYGVIAQSGNLANNTFMNLAIEPAKGAKDGVAVRGGQLVIMNSCLGGGGTKPQGAAVAVYAGGVNIYGAWSEWQGPFLYGPSQGPMPGSQRADSNARYSTILAGIQHYPAGSGPGAKPESENTVPLSIKWDFCEPLTLINCSFWGGVELGPNSGSPIIDIGTTFSNRDIRRYSGEGIEKYGRLLQIGTVHPDNVRAVEPYIVDRRNTPGTKPPKTGIWKKGDCIRNTDPDLAAPAKAWAGWICMEAGEPGKWAPFGAIGK